MERKSRLHIKEIILCGLFAGLIGVGTFIKVPIPYVPFTLQFLFTNLAGILLGKKWGSISVAVYILIGLLGVPVFTSGGGIGYIVHPTFGYLLGYMAGAYIAGYIVEKVKVKSSRTILMAGFANIAIVYIMGVAYFYLIHKFHLQSDVGIRVLFIYCFAVFVPGDALKCFLSMMLYKKLVPVIERG